MNTRSPVFIIPITPIPWSRPGRNKTTNTYYDNQKKDKIAFGCYISRLNGNRDILTGPLKLYITFYMTQPKIREHEYWHHIKPDIDNLEKFILDACTSIIYTDDCQISWVDKAKVYDVIPRVEFYFEKLTKLSVRD